MTKELITLVNHHPANFKIKLKCPFCNSKSFALMAHSNCRGNIHKCSNIHCGKNVVVSINYILDSHGECIYTIKVSGYDT